MEYYTRTWSDESQSYKKARYGCLALKSTLSGRHLVSIHPRFVGSSSLYEPIFSADTSKDSHTIIFPMEDPQKETPIKFYLENHTNKYTKIDLMKDNDPISEVDMPLRGLNQINELKPYGHYEIIVDQTNDKRRITVVAKDRRESKTGKLETATEKDVYINAFTPANSPYVEDFRSAVWEITDVIVTEKREHSFFELSEDEDEDEFGEIDQVDGDGWEADTSNSTLEYYTAGFGSGGERIVESVGYVGIDYAYDVINKTAVGFVVVNSKHVEIFNRKNEDTDNFFPIESKVKETFPSEECVICQTEQPSILLAPCGHKCMCSACNNAYKENRCPLCRSFLNAKIII